MLLHAPAYEADAWRSVYRALIDALGPNSAVTVLAEANADVDGLLDGRRATTIKAPAGATLTAWARDALIAAGDTTDRPLFLATSALDRRDDAQAPALFAAATGARLIPTGLPFEGGDILIDRDRVLVGADSLRRIGRGDAHAGGRALAAMFASVDGRARAILPVGGRPGPSETERPTDTPAPGWTEVVGFGQRPDSRQPIFHIDMFVSLTGLDRDGRPIALVGDHVLAARALGHAPLPHATPDAFAAIAHDLRAAGYAVERLPLPLLWTDDVVRRRRTWFFASYNNVLVADGVVWLPEYGHDGWPEVDRTDKLAAAIWRRLGFEVRAVPGCLPLAENLGGLHCLANVIRRRPG